MGSIYVSVNNTNPGNIFGGTWERFANGRTLVGVDENDGSFNGIKKIGGHKDLQNHSHNMSSHTHVINLISGVQSVSHTHTGQEVLLANIGLLQMNHQVRILEM